MDLSIVIVNWNSRSHLSRLLDSLVPLKREVSKIVVIDNGSTDSSESVVIQDELTELIAFQDNKGFAHAANLGIDRTTTDFVLLVNPDILILEDTVRELFREIALRPNAAIVCGALITEEGQPQDAFQIRSLPTFWSVLSDVLFGDELFGLLGFGGSRTAQQLETATPIEVEQPAAAFWLLRKEVWSSIGGFDESFFPAWFEDVDFCKRLVGTNWRIFYFPQLRVFHHGGASLESVDYKEFLDVYYGNLLKYWKKHHRVTFPLIYLPVRSGLIIRRLLGSR